MQEHKSNDDEDKEQDYNFHQFSFCSYPTSNNINLKDSILLDNQSSENVVTNKELFTKIWKSDKSIMIKGVAEGQRLSWKTRADTKAISQPFS